MITRKYTIEEVDNIMTVTRKRDGHTVKCWSDPSRVNTFKSCINYEKAGGKATNHFDYWFDIYDTKAGLFEVTDHRGNTLCRTAYIHQALDREIVPEGTRDAAIRLARVVVDSFREGRTSFLRRTMYGYAKRLIEILGQK